MLGTLLSWLSDAFIFIVTVIVPVIIALAVVAFAFSLLFGLARNVRRWMSRVRDQVGSIVAATSEELELFVFSSLHFLGAAFVREVGLRHCHNLFRPSSREAAERAAIERQQFVRREIERRPTREIIEIAPGLPEVEGLLHNDLSEHRSIAQEVRLQYQAASTELLLFARLFDTLVYLVRLDEYNQGSRRGPVSFDVSLRKLRRWERGARNSFGWVATIGTRDRQLFEESLTELREWLGLGIEFTKPARHQLQRRCLQDDDQRALGTIAGILQERVLESAYPITCSHVLPGKCNNKVFADFVPGNDVPDAMLLKQHMICIPSKELLPPLKVVTASEVALLHSGETRLQRLAGHSPKYTGWLPNGVYQSYMTEGVTYNFSACSVLLLRRLYFVVSWPLFRRRFSLRGDSGSWVIVPAGILGPEPRLLGMIQAGGPHGSHVLLAEALLAYFEKLLKLEPASLEARPFRESE